MAQIILGAAGAALGFMAGGPQGAMIGWSIGSALGSSMAPATQVQGQQQSIMDLRVTGTEYGQPIPYVFGAAAVAGQVWWNTDRRPTTTTTTTHTGSGKGGGGGTDTTSSSITYDMDMLIGLTDHPIAGISRIWMDGGLIYTADVDAEDASVLASQVANAWTRCTIYKGDDAQLPDPTYEAAVGVENACAYRGRGSVFIESLKLGGSGQVPNITFEVLTTGVETILVSADVRFDGARTFSGLGGLVAGDPTVLEGAWGGPFGYGYQVASVGNKFIPVGADNGSWNCEFRAT